MSNEHEEDDFLALKVVMMPRDTNPHGTIFGGVLLSYIDQAGAVGARQSIRVRGWPIQGLVTVAMNAVEFNDPVFVGDTVSFVTRPIRWGRTSITMQVRVLADRIEQATELTAAQVTYVAIDLKRDRQQPIPLNPDATSS